MRPTRKPARKLAAPKLLALLSSAVTLCAPPSARAADPLYKAQKGDNICVIGNTLAERIQHDGWLEAYLYARHPDAELTIRNLGYSGDEVDPAKRLRSKNFGTPDQWLAGSAPVPTPSKIGNPKDVSENRFERAGTNADVVFMFFGYNESFAGDAGLDKFRKDLDGLLKHTAGQNYNGTSAPRVVLFSPIAHEDLKDPNLPDGQTSNARLAKYTAAMGEVAKANGAAFVDLFAASRKLYDATAQPLTINGVHLNELGNKLVAEAIDAALAGGDAGQHDAAKVEAIRTAVVDKAWHWFQRYRKTDGFNTYGDRAFLQFKPDNQSNYEPLQRELEQLDVMTANRDEAIRAVAQGRPAGKIDDSDAPPPIVVKTNKPGPNADGLHPYKGGEEAMADTTLAPTLEIQLFADEKMFPEMVNPVQMSFDAKGRLWVATWPSYPHWAPKTPMNDRLLILEDTDADGKADACKTFAGDLQNPTGFEFYDGGVLLAQGSELWFMKDADGDDKVDVRERVLHGFDTADTHHTINSFTFDPGGALYMQEGTFHHSQVETPWGPPVRSANGAVYRYEPKTRKLSTYASYGFANPHGHVFDRWGTDIVTDGTGAVPHYGPAFSGRTDFPRKHGKGNPVIYKQRTRPCPATEILSSSHFPEHDGNFLVPNVIGFLGILNYKLGEKGGGVVGTEVEPIVQSSDPNFRPSDLEVAPDGSLYFTDWHNTIIGHMQHNLRDPSRDRQHGRVYRITHKTAPLLKPAKIAGEPVDALLALLRSPEDRVRYRAKIELGGRKSDEVIPAVKKWAAALDKSDKAYDHQLTEALWVHQWHNVVDPDLLKRVLKAKEPMARAAATRVLCYWADRVPDALELLTQQAKDAHPRVALEAVRAASFFDKDQAEHAMEVALEALEKHEGDAYVKYALDETVKQLEAVQQPPVPTEANYEREGGNVRVPAKKK